MTYDPFHATAGAESKPSSYLLSVLPMLESGKTLCLGAGAGPTAIHLASLGFSVSLADDDPRILDAARSQAEASGALLETQLMDWSRCHWGDEVYFSIISLFCHPEAKERRRLHESVPRSLRPGGIFVMEALRLGAIRGSSGDPTDPSRLVSKQQIFGELVGLDWIRIGEVELCASAGRGAQGRVKLLQVVARKPHVHRPRGLTH